MTALGSFKKWALGEQEKPGGPEKLKKLTEHQAFVMSELVKGRSPKEIAYRRGSGEFSIYHTIKRARVKLGAKTIFQAVALFAVEDAKK